jgi:4-oxalocrotonate tautomerase
MSWKNAPLSRGRKKMPHVIVKLYAGRTEQQKTRLAQQLTKAVTTTLKCGEDAVSVSIEDIEPEDWVEQVYKKDILSNPETVYKKPGYNPL